ncbi:hypothetical protein [Brevundimonas sp.]|uniref:hypothetical protein n=1 Tax=Brevundimonas sp. TaxID=1871086 RepID=UPI0027301672|nr:hypothetical protein [Brevundimonas sp.]MDP1914592.1 hypothetical protein [Brevundimonas sp.]
MIGDILAFSNRNLPALLYHTHENPLMGSLVRVFCSVEFDTEAIDRALAREPDFQCFFPVNAAVRRKDLRILEPRPPQGRWARFPMFKAEGLSRDTWWLWDGDREWPYEGAVEAISDYPERESVNDTMMISLISKRCVSCIPK